MTNMFGVFPTHPIYKVRNTHMRERGEREEGTDISKLTIVISSGVKKEDVVEIIRVNSVSIV